MTDPMNYQRQPMLAVRDLRTCFRVEGGIACAVDGVSFDLYGGETYALVGESGCGKSVTALSILQLTPKPASYIDSGSIRLEGREITALPPLEMRRIRGDRISMVFQEPMTALNPVLTIGAQIGEVLRLHQGLDPAAVRLRTVEALARVGIPDADRRVDEYPHQMSGGMCQRVMIAMALACRPRVLIADEPTTALDVTIQAQILSLIRELQRELGTAVLLITHDMGVVRENAERVGVMYAGRIVEEAPREVLFAGPSHPYTQLLLRSMPARATRGQSLMTIPGAVPRPTQWPKGCRFASRCPFAFDRCRESLPPRFPTGPNHWAECFLADPSLKRPTTLATESGSASAPTATPGSELRVEVRDLAMHFPIRRGILRRVAGHVRAVDGVSLAIRQSETLALVGESGCGKTTVGRCLVRLLQPTGGDILYRGQNIAPLTRGQLKPVRRRMQMIFQDPFSSLNPRRRIEETITEGMATHGIGASAPERKERAARLLQRVGLDPAMVERYPHEFSGGQRQRIGLARALAVEPELLICDEATSSLDVSVQAQILNLLRELQGEFGLSYLLITHDLSVVKYLADRVSVMYLGRIVEEGANRDIFENPAHPYTRALLAAVPQVDGPLGRKRLVLGGDVPSPSNPPPGCPFHPRCPFAKPACRETRPALEPMTPGAAITHRVACLRHKEIAEG